MATNKPFDYEGECLNFSLEIPNNFNFAFDIVAKRANEADKIALISIDRTAKLVTKHRYSDLERHSNQFANVLLGLGAKQGDFVFVMIPRQPAWYQVLLACMKTGVVAMPGTNLLTAKDIHYRINRSRAKFAIVTADHVEKIESIRHNCPTLEHLIAVDGQALEDWLSMPEACATASSELDRSKLPMVRSTDPMLLYFTSGTTSLPKMVERDHGYALAHTITQRYWMTLNENDIHWTLTDTGWAKAAWGLFFPPLLAGSTILLFDGGGFDADQHLKIIETHKITTFCAPPTIYRLFAQMDVSKYDLSSLRHCIGAGEPLNPEAMRSWKAATGCDVYDGYGQTETINIVANYPGMDIRPGSMGKPVPGINVNIIDDDGRICQNDEVGHIGVKITDPYPFGLFTGYFEDTAGTAQAFRNGWYYTGDTATRDKDGYIWFVGSSDDIISSAGYRISPFEVESALIEHPAVQESAVVGKVDPIRGEIVKAFVILAPGNIRSNELAKDIQNFVKNVTAPYKYPREIEFKEELPKTISGKIRRVELRSEANNAKSN